MTSRPCRGGMIIIGWSGSLGSSTVYSTISFYLIIPRTSIDAETLLSLWKCDIQTLKKCVWFNIDTWPLVEDWGGSNIGNKRESTVIISNHLVQTERHHLRCLWLSWTSLTIPVPAVPQRFPRSIFCFSWRCRTHQNAILGACNGDSGRNHRFTADLHEPPFRMNSIHINLTLANQQTQPE